MAGVLREFAESGLVNLVGGCCGTTPEHIRAIAEAVRGLPPRRPAQVEAKCRLSGLEPLTIGPPSVFSNIGERTNVTGSRKFARLILAGEYDAAVEIARQQVESGAVMIDVNMDEGMLDSRQAMVRFLQLIASEPDISRVPVVVDSSKWSVIEAGLKCLQGKGIVNSISLKEGEEAFSSRRRSCDATARRSSSWPSTSAARPTASSARWRSAPGPIASCAIEWASRPRTSSSIRTSSRSRPGIEEHAHYALDYIEATRRIKETLPHVLVSGGVSNVSFSFRGNDPVREAIHAVFLYHAIEAGMDMGIVNAGQLPIYSDIPPDLLERVEDLVLDRRPDATDRLLSIADSVRGRAAAEVADLAWRNAPVRRATGPCVGRGYCRLRRGGHRRGAPSGGTADPRDRRPVDGWDEHRRRSLWLGEDVPAAGREERPGHEEGGRAPDPLHRGGEARSSAPREQREGAARHGEG